MTHPSPAPRAAAPDLPPGRVPGSSLCTRTLGRHSEWSGAEASLTLCPEGPEQTQAAALLAGLLGVSVGTQLAELGGSETFAGDLAWAAALDALRQDPGAGSASWIRAAGALGWALSGEAGQRLGWAAWLSLRQLAQGGAGMILTGSWGAGSWGAGSWGTDEQPLSEAQADSLRRFGTLIVTAPGPGQAAALRQIAASDLWRDLTDHWPKDARLLSVIRLQELSTALGMGLLLARVRDPLPQDAAWAESGASTAAAGSAEGWSWQDWAAWTVHEEYAGPGDGGRAGHMLAEDRGAGAAQQRLSLISAALEAGRAPGLALCAWAGLRWSRESSGNLTLVARAVPEPETLLGTQPAQQARLRDFGEVLFKWISGKDRSDWPAWWPGEAWHRPRSGHNALMSLATLRLTGIPRPSVHAPQEVRS